MAKRVFILGAGFSKPAGMPLATDLLPLLADQLKHKEMCEWLDDLRERLAWLSGRDHDRSWFKLNIEQVFHHAHFDIEAHRLRQHLAPVGRRESPGTPWRHAESIEAWLGHMQEALRDVILRCDLDSDLTSIKRWASAVCGQDAVLTFNYDTLAERALADEGKAWNLGTGRAEEGGIGVFKLHGSIDWIVAHRNESPSELTLLFDKQDAIRFGGKSGHVEDDYRLWRCRTHEQLADWIKRRSLQRVENGASQRAVGIAGLGAYKQLHQVPGLGMVWRNGLRSLYEADAAVVVGFSMSDFDAMAQMQFAEVARARTAEQRPLRVIVVDPTVNEDARRRFERVFRCVEFVEKGHETLDWRTVG